MTMLNICIVTALIDHGGASIIAFNVARGMSEKGHQVTVVCSGKTEKAYSENGYDVVVLEQKIKNLYYHYFNPLLLWKLKKALNNLQPDIIHFHNINLQTFSLFSLFFSRFYPSVWTLHDVWPLCLTGWPDVPDCEGLNNKCRRCPSWPYWMVKTNKFVKDNVYKFSKMHIVSPSRWLVSLLKDSSLGKQPISVIYNGVSPDSFYKDNQSSIRANLNIPRDKKIILFCGGKKLAGQLPAWRKGWIYLCRALEIIGNKYGNLHLLFVGDPLNLPKKFPVSTSFAEGVSRTNMKNYYNASDILVLPTLADHPALTILEAMACKLPVIASDTCGIPEAIISNETGLLCPPRDPIALAKEIEFLILSPDYGTQMAAQAYKRFLKMFTFDRMIVQYEDVYKKAISSFYRLKEYDI